MVIRGSTRKAEQGRIGDHATRTSLVDAWGGAGDVGPVQPGYESGDTDAMPNAFNRDTHRALADCVEDRTPWPGWFGQGLQAMSPSLRGHQAYEADRTRWVLQQSGGAERLEAATVRRLQMLAYPNGALKLAREWPVITALNLIRDRAERRRREQAIADGGRGGEEETLPWQRLLSLQPRRGRHVPLYSSTE